MNADYEREQETLENSTEELGKTVETCEEQRVNVKSFIKTVQRYIEPTELTPEMLHEFVNKIVVHAPDMLPAIGDSRLTFTIISLERLRYPAKLQKEKQRDMS